MRISVQLNDFDIGRELQLFYNADTNIGAVVSFQGTSPKYVKRSDELVLRLQASLPEIGCAITSTGSMGKHMVYTFSELTGAFSGRFIGVNPRVLRVPEDSLVPGITYRFLGTVAMAANPGINGSAC